MTFWAKLTVVAAGMTAGVVTTIAIGSLRWNRQTSETVAHLDTPRERTPAVPAFARTQLAGLPAPVARYFLFALAPGQPAIQRAHIRWAGDFLIKPGGGWSPFTAEQDYAVNPPSFVWDATIRMARVLPVRVRDSYVAGTGVLVARLVGVLALANQQGTSEMATGELLRYLAEGPWFPTALLPSQRLSWAAVDDSSARATLVDRGVRVSIDFVFGASGEIVRSSAQRPRDVGGHMEVTPWVGHYRDYERIHGVMVPRAGSVEWILPQGALPYWRAHFTGVTFETAR